MLFFLFFFQLCFAQEPGMGIWKSICQQSSDCIGYLICQEGRCIPPNPPSEKQCSNFSFAHYDTAGQKLSQCPPDCGFKEDPIYGPYCITNEQGCLSSALCREEGYCAFDGKQCTLSEEGCASSAQCLIRGECGFDGKKCVATKEGCSLSSLCKNEGWCAYIPGPKDYEASHGTCGRSKSGCSQSLTCRQKGKCGFENGSCTATAQGCANSMDCKQQEICRYQRFQGCLK
ncbi:MAG: hypothetical protein VX278_23830 [Myxococcota bacterium]|nr:hypothetical protein [Myxococcota bacterium]